MNFVRSRKQNGQPRSQRNSGANVYMLFEVHGATNVEAMSQCVYKFYEVHGTTNVVAKSQW